MKNDAKMKINKRNLLFIIQGLFVLTLLLSGAYILFLEESGLAIIFSIIYSQLIAVLFMSVFLIIIGNKLLGDGNNSFNFGITTLSLIISYLVSYMSITQGYGKMHDFNNFDHVLSYEIMQYIPVFIFIIVCLFTVVTIVYFVKYLIEEKAFVEKQKNTMEEMIRELMESNDEIEQLLGFTDGDQIRYILENPKTVENTDDVVINDQEKIVDILILDSDKDKDKNKKK